MDNQLEAIKSTSSSPTPTIKINISIEVSIYIYGVGLIDWTDQLLAWAL